MHASNTPISRPVDTGHRADVDFGGIMWSRTAGLIFAPRTESLPIRPPSPARKW